MNTPRTLSKSRLNRLLALALLLSPVALAGCEPVGRLPTSQSPASASHAGVAATANHHASPAAAMASAVDASNHLALSLYAQLAQRPGNLAYSPASVSMALSMAYAGARGATAAEMKRVLRLPDDGRTLHQGWSGVLEHWSDAKGVEMAVATRMFGEQAYRFEDPFLSLAKSQYRAPLLPVDFAGAPQHQRTLINDWVAKHTRQRVQHLIPQDGVNSDTKMALVNAISFKSKWASPFLGVYTRQAPFAAPTGTRQVAMMGQDAKVMFAEVGNAKIVQRDYQDRDYAAMFVLPKAGVALSDVEKTLDSKRLEQWTSSLQRQAVSLKLPRFKIDPKAPLDLSATLKHLGLEVALDRAKADFTGIANPARFEDQLFIEKVFHKAFVDMDEKGTEAAAASAVMASCRGGRLKTDKTFHADRPFLFFIRDKKTNMIVFAGRVTDPS